MSEERDQSAERAMEQRGDEMEQRLNEVEEHLDEAKQAAANPPVEPDEGVAGDWEGEATGSQQGEDAKDTESGG